MKYRAAAELVRSAKSIFMITGWGLSAPSGIPRLTPNKELWEQDPRALLSNTMLQMRPRKLWEFTFKYKSLIANCTINPAHTAVKNLHSKLKAQGKGLHVTTLAIDGFLRKSWEEMEDLTELHGNVNYMRCPQCLGKKVDVIGDGSEVPVCDKCKKPMRPHVVFGDESDLKYFSYAEPKFNAMVEKGLQSDCMIVVGSMLENGLMRGLVSDHLTAKKPIININKENDGDWIKGNVASITEACETSLPKLVDEVCPSNT
eukprot:TRINITY_DN1763_c0_g3_i5.p1 TRINITY_DN1763_c0_g3~~TRINITY_DN1763_c0_g3_i5.p1  ORF type:complete len:281 (-),score=27.58 TRINITY_DN1763_c0_g3_i5:41-814(-)